MDYGVRVLLEGRWTAEQVEVVKEELEPLSPNVVERVEALWAEEVTRNPHLRPGPLLVAKSVDTVDDGARLRFACGESNYKNFMGTTHETVAQELAEGQIHRATGIMAVLTTADQRAVIGVRSPKVDWPTTRHVAPAGRLRPADVHPFSGIRDEARTELGLDDATFSDPTCVGVVGDLTYGRLNTEFVFRARTLLTAEEVVAAAKAAKSANEHCWLEFWPWEASFVRELLLESHKEWVPTGWAGVAIALRSDFGEEAFPLWTPRGRTYVEAMGPLLTIMPREPR